MNKSPPRILWTLLNELAEFTGFGPLDPKEIIEETCKDWLLHLAKLKLERAKNEQKQIPRLDS